MQNDTYGLHSTKKNTAVFEQTVNKSLNYKKIENI